MTSRHLLFLLASRLYSLGSPLPALFIMGHMRCGSTLLLHILITNPALIGCGERNAPYNSHPDLDKLAVAARIAQRAPFRRVRYAVDQINHDELTPSRALLDDARVRLIFMSRAPGPTIHSILELTRTYYGGAWSVREAVDYYCRRLRTLAEHAAHAADGGKAMALSYEALVDETATVFGRIEAFLGVDTPLNEQYRIRSFTGERGDPSEKIREGRIVQRRVDPGHEVPSVELEKATAAYEDYLGAIESLTTRGHSAGTHG